MSSWAIDFTTLSSKINETVRTIKEEVEQSVDNALGIDENANAKAKAINGDNDFDYWNDDDESWDINKEVEEVLTQKPTVKSEPEEAVLPVSSEPVVEAIVEHESAQQLNVKQTLEEKHHVRLEENVDEIRKEVKEEPTEEPAEESVEVKDLEEPQQISTADNAQAGEQVVLSAKDGQKDVEGSHSDGIAETVEALQQEEVEESKSSSTQAESGESIESLYKRFALQNAQLATLASELDEEKSTSTNKGIQIRDLMQENEKLRAEAKKMHAQLQKRSSSAAKLKKKELEVQEILQEGEKLSKRQHESEQTIKKLKAKIQQLESTNQEAIERGMGNLDEVHDKIKSLERDCEDYKTQVLELTLQLESTTVRVEELQKILKENQDGASRTIERLTHDLDESSRQLHKSEEQYAEVAAELPQATRHLVQQIEQLQKELESKSETWISAENGLNAHVRNLEDRIVAAEKERDKLKRDLVASHQNTDALQAESLKLQRHASDLKEALDSANNGPDDELLNESEEKEADEALDRLQAQLLEEKWKRESAEIELAKLKESFQQQLRVELEMSTQKQVPSASENKVLANASLNGHEDLDYSMDTAEQGIPGLSSNKFNLESDRVKNLIQASSSTSKSELETICNKLAEELIEKSRLLSAHEEKLKGVKDIDVTYKNLKRRHEMALELMGEKEEEIEHLHSDLNDLKRLYQEHITDVLEKIKKGGSN